LTTVRVSTSLYVAVTNVPKKKKRKNTPKTENTKVFSCVHVVLPALFLFVNQSLSHSLFFCWFISDKLAVFYSISVCVFQSGFLQLHLKKGNIRSKQQEQAKKGSLVFARFFLLLLSSRSRFSPFV
jgi:hypothetical protein